MKLLDRNSCLVLKESRIQPLSLFGVQLLSLLFKELEAQLLSLLFKESKTCVCTL